jgi:hypothetical protein
VCPDFNSRKARDEGGELHDFAGGSWPWFKNDIELTFVLGDIAWGGSGKNRNLGTAKKILDRLNNNGITYIPVIGDNEVQYGCEKEFQEVFGPHYKSLSSILDNWRKASIGLSFRVS